MKAKKFLVTGAGGFIGTALCRHLDLLDASYTGIGRQKFSKIKTILNRQRPSVIFHLAGGRGETFKMIEANVLTTLELFETIRSIPNYHPKVIVIGSAAEYGNQHRSSAIRESSRAKPDNIYGLVKLTETHTTLQYARHGENALIARLFNIIGPGIPQGTAAGKFAFEITGREKLTSPPTFQVADLGGVRDFLDIRDIVEALIVLSGKGKSGEIYNICSGKRVVMRDLLKRMVAASGNPSIKYFEDTSQKPGVLYAVGSAAKFKKISHWQPRYSLQQSIHDTLNDYRKHL